jgi:hypothetical protein
VREYLLHLVQRGVSWSLYNQVRCALHVGYRVTLGTDWPKEEIVCAKSPKRLPVVLRRDELRRLSAPVAPIKARAVLMTLDAAGLRVSELVGLKIRDIDRRRMVIRVEQGKGQKDRYVMLSTVLLGVLRDYGKAHQPASWLFPGTDPDQPLDRGTVGRICQAAARRAGLSKPVSPHTLRHTFATHLIGGGHRPPDHSGAPGPPKPADHRRVHRRVARANRRHAQSPGRPGRSRRGLHRPDRTRDARPVGGTGEGRTMNRPAHEVADVIRAEGPAFRARYGRTLSSAPRRARHDLARCRPAALGGHAEACDSGGQVRVAYHSCRNRHGPKCQAAARAEWLERQAADLLPVEYFHVVFTLPTSSVPGDGRTPLRSTAPCSGPRRRV